VRLSVNNIFDNDTFGVENADGAVLDATRNFWGDATGPTHATNPGGAGDAVSDDVDFSRFATGAF
jgi:hypothetical protein